jgi:hypothetical protein
MNLDLADDDNVEEIFHDAAAEPPDVLLASIRDSIVSDRTRSCYTSEIFCILFWLRNNQAHVLTEEGRLMIDCKKEENKDLSARQLYKKVREKVLDDLRSANEKKFLRKNYLRQIFIWTI